MLRIINIFFSIRQFIVFFHETHNYKHVRLIIEPKEVLEENSSSGVLSAVIN